MQFVHLDSWLPDVAPQVPGCTRFAIRDALRLSAIEFCRKAGVSVETTRELDIEADERVVTLSTPGAQVKVLHLLWAETTHGPLTVLDRQSIGERGARVDGGRTAKWPKYLMRETRNTYLLDPVPTEDHDSALTVHCSYIPRDNASRVDERLLTEYREAIKEGALSRLLRQAGTPWYDRVAAGDSEQEFRYQVKQACAMAAKDFQTGPQHVVIRPLA